MSAEVDGAAAVVDGAALDAALHRGGTLGPDQHVVACEGVPIGAGQLADSFRVELDYGSSPPGPASVFVKLPTADPDSASTAARIGAYRREQHFYQDLLPHLDVRTPRLLGVFDADGAAPGLVLEDLSDRARPLDQLKDGTIEEVTSAVRELPGLQAPLWDDPEVGALPWFYNRLTDHIHGLHERYAISWERHGDVVGAALDAGQREIVERFGAACLEWAASISGPRTLVHQDLRLDNLLHGPDGAWLVDWQTLSWGPPAWDLAFLLGTALAPVDRRAVERRLVEEHVALLAARGVGWEPDEAWTAYRQLSGAALLGMVPAMAFVEPTSRGFDMFRSLIARGAQQAIDLDLSDFLTT